MTKRTLLLLVIGIGGFLVIYLYYVKQERMASIARYFPDPQINDVYKMERHSREEGREVYYLKLKDIGKESLYFYPSRMSSTGIHDGFLNHFDTLNVVVYSRKEMEEIHGGNTGIEILEIKRSQ
jgi:hypothetical protein